MSLSWSLALVVVLPLPLWPTVKRHDLVSILDPHLTPPSPQWIRPQYYFLSTGPLFAVDRRLRGNHRVSFQTNPNLKGGMVLLRVREVFENPSAICALHDLAYIRQGNGDGMRSSWSV